MVIICLFTFSLAIVRLVSTLSVASFCQTELYPCDSLSDNGMKWHAVKCSSPAPSFHLSNVNANQKYTTKYQSRTNTAQARNITV